MNDDTLIVPEEFRVLVVAPEEWVIEVPAEYRVIEATKPCS
jgi:hypothetical protein